MILRSIIADNLFQTRKIRLTELPENGIIAVSGSEQSARECVIESVCFALFGHTCVSELSYQGIDGGSVTLHFSLDGGEEYEVVRSIDRHGLQCVSLRIVAESMELLEVDQGVIDKLIGFSYELFTEHLLLAVVAESDRPPLSKLMEYRDQAGQQLQEKQALLSSLNYRMALFQGSGRTIRKAKRGLKQSNFFQGVMFLYTLYLLLAALSISIVPESTLAGVLTSQLMAQYPSWNPAELSPLLYSILGLTLLLAFTWGLCLILKKRIRGLLQVPEKIAEALAGLDQLAKNAPAEHAATRQVLREKLLDATALPDEVQHHIEQMMPWVELSLDQSRAALAVAERDIEQVEQGIDNLESRLGTTQEILSEAAIKRQFIFLNGHYASTLLADLMRSRGVLRQIWLFAETPPEGEEISLHIQCEGGVMN
ncbi:MAG: hypothetical protein L3J28_02410 [Candidatus Polarisedimenticolaceae bacterium]|nr:hypothetical protein [Candidatus Polarisedimenticolaceae bacterium]